MSDYVCPQCGPDPAGAESHAERYHVWPPCSCPDAVPHRLCANPTYCECSVHDEEDG